MKIPFSYIYSILLRKRKLPDEQNEVRPVLHALGLDSYPPKEIDPFDDYFVE